MGEKIKESNSEFVGLGQCVPYSIELFKKNEFHKVRLKNVYDPSKFWIVIKYNELQLFTNYLTAYYNKSDRKVIVPKIELKHGLTCIILKNSKFYRANLLPALLPENNKLRVFLLDYGCIISVEMSNVFYMLKKHCNVPRFSIRATLAYISPANQYKPWCSTDLHRFCELLSEQDLSIKVMEIDFNLKILHVDIIRINDSMGESINNLLVKSGIAGYSQLIEESKEKSKYKNKVKYMHLCPSFNALERGGVPSSLWEQNLLKDVHLNLLYSYYQLKNERFGVTH
ncbi:tudor domain-containing protein 6 isoform X1 [Leptinotarsa decemlineata]|uniref:tudor domain-containing protein 6 isoform X1 n=1 Tax=Leptinotarsa decemlineata TaxID=7539 RepID=UPI003D30A710